MQLANSKMQSRNLVDTVNVFHHRADNIGDRMCGPAQYFWPTETMNVGFIYELSADEHAILGGGQVFGQIAKYTEKCASVRHGSLVAWGVGLPVKGKEDALVRAVASRFAMFGARNYEWKDELRFVPCPSCMSGLFDNAQSPTHEVVVYSHRRKTPLLAQETEFPSLTNNDQNAADVIAFIASGETVVTSSYHGVYWAQLLGRKVICVPYSNKFSTLQHQPKISSTETWRSDLKYASQAEPLLEEYRCINRNFASEVAALLDLDG